MLDRTRETPVETHKVAQWCFDADAGQINAVDEQGRVLMVIQAGPLFGARLAAAFTSPVSSAAPSAPRGR